MLLFSEATFAILIVLSVLVTNVACLPASGNVGEGKTTTTNPPKICDTQGCEDIASLILESMDRTVDPCSDFFRFACGKFIDKTAIPIDQSSISRAKMLDILIQQELGESIESKITKKSPHPFQILKSSYDTCMNTKKIEVSSEKELRDILKTLGDWPVLNGKLWVESVFDWQKLAIQLRSNGYSINYFIGFGISIDLKDNSKHVLVLNQAETALPQEYLSKGLKDQTVQAYLKYMTDLAVIFGANLDAAKKELTESLNFEIELAKISLSREQRRDLIKIYNPMSIKQLQETYKYVQWLDYFNKILAPQAKVKLEDTVIVMVPSYLQKLPDLISKTPKRVLANYAMWRVVAESATRLSERVLKATDEFSAASLGIKNRPPRWKQCVTYVTNYLSILVNAVYARLYFDETSKADVTDLFENIRKTYEGLVTKVDWMDEKTKSTAIDKIKKIRPYIAYPSELLDNKKLDEYYQGLKLYPESYLKSANSIRIFETSKDFEELRKPVNISDWRSHNEAAIANAYYSPQENSIKIPAGILQGLFFTKDAPKYINYGGIGQIIGHELTHSNDDQGSQFDAKGNFRDWWQPLTKQKFNERGDCFVSQYSNYEVKQVDMKVNGKMTEGENIADNGGLREAFFAYNEWEKQHGKEPQLHAELPYTSQQMFFVSFASRSCSKYTNEAMKALLMTNVHTPAEFRVIGSISNMPEFSQHFKCPKGSPMNRPKPCVLW